MSLVRAWKLLRKDLKLGPRSPIFLYAVVFPVVITLLVNLVFGSLFEPTPRLGVVDEGSSEISQAVTELEGIEVTLIDSESRLKEMVEANDLDAGLVLQQGFDDAVRAGENPELQLFIGGQSLASNRVVLAVTAADLVRGVAGSPAPIEVVVTTIGGGEAVPILSRLLPLLVLFAMVIAGLFVPAASLVEEKEKGTLSAVLVTPAEVSEVMAAKGGLGFVLAIGAGLVTLALNNALGANALALVLVLVLAALMSVEFGLMLGSWAKDANTLFTVIKGAGILLYAPVIFFIWPGLPQWIAQIFPTYYYLLPLFEIAVKGATLADVGAEVAIGFAITALLLAPVFALGRRMETTLAAD